MTRPRRHILSFDGMEPRSLLSAAAIGTLARVHEEARQHGRILGGSFQAYLGLGVVPQFGEYYDGSGTIKPMGNVKVQGFFPFTRPRGQPGTMTLANDQGSVTLSITENRSVASSPIRFVVRNGTGAFADVHGHGTITMRLDPSTPQGPRHVNVIDATLRTKS